MPKIAAVPDAPHKAPMEPPATYAIVGAPHVPQKVQPSPAQQLKPSPPPVLYAAVSQPKIPTKMAPPAKAQPLQPLAKPTTYPLISNPTFPGMDVIHRQPRYSRSSSFSPDRHSRIHLERINEIDHHPVFPSELAEASNANRHVNRCGKPFRSHQQKSTVSPSLEVISQEREPDSLPHVFHSQNRRFRNLRPCSFHCVTRIVIRVDDSPDVILEISVPNTLIAILTQSHTTIHSVCRITDHPTPIILTETTANEIE